MMIVSLLVPKQKDFLDNSPALIRYCIFKVFYRKKNSICIFQYEFNFCFTSIFLLLDLFCSLYTYIDLHAFNIFAGDFKVWNFYILSFCVCYHCCHIVLQYVP